MMLFLPRALSIAVLENTQDESPITRIFFVSLLGLFESIVRTYPINLMAAAEKYQ